MPNRELLAELATIAPVNSIEISVGGGAQKCEGIREASVGGPPGRSASVRQHGRREWRAGDCLIAALLSVSPLQDDAVLAILRLKSLRSFGMVNSDFSYENRKSLIEKLGPGVHP